MEKEFLSMTEIQSVSLEILKKVSDFCDENNIKYFLAYGTLIGAIRHHDYIPWDDDVDIMMERPDYDKFLTLFKEKNDVSYLELFTLESNPNYPYNIARVSDSRYYIEVENEKPCGLGIFIDIYPLDGVGHSRKEALATMKKTTKYPSLIFQSTRVSYNLGNTKGFFRKIFKFPAFIFAHIMGKDYFVERLKKIVSKFQYDDNEYVAVAMWASRPKFYPKKWFKNLIKWKFSKYEFFIPNHYDEVLRESYGDYMQLPPEEDRIYQHLYKAYKK